MADVHWPPLRSTARVLTIVAVVFWFWFAMGALFGRAEPLDWWIYVVGLGGLSLPSLLVAWRWKGIGGTLLTLEGIVTLSFVVDAFIWRRVASSTLIVVSLTLVLPLLSLGVLFMLHRWKSR